MRISEALELLALGPMTSKELATEADVSFAAARDVIGNLRKANSKRPQMVYIHSWRLLRSTWVPVYALGDEKDARKPRISRQEQNRRYRARRALITSVFDLALPVKVREKRASKIAQTA